MKSLFFLWTDPVPTRDGCARGQFLCPVIFLFLGIHGQISCLGKLLHGKIRMVDGKGEPGGNTQRPHLRPGPGRRNPLQRRQNFLRLGLGHLTQHHELIPTDAEDFPPIPHRLGDTLGSAAYQLVPCLMPQGIVDTL